MTSGLEFGSSRFDFALLLSDGITLLGAILVKIWEISNFIVLNLIFMRFIPFCNEKLYLFLSIDFIRGPDLVFKQMEPLMFGYLV